MILISALCSLVSSVASAAVSTSAAAAALSAKAVTMSVPVVGGTITSATTAIGGKVGTVVASGVSGLGANPATVGVANAITANSTTTYLNYKVKDGVNKVRG